ncbi:MAG: NfeD family protein [Eubacterium sp.]|nr:NfeD family protein [Eubacterium sp.]
MIMEVLIWLGIMILLLIIEAITVGLTTIWFAAGALVALIASMLGAGITVQALLFFAVSLILLFFTRPIAVRYINPQKIRTNYEDTIDKTVKITRCVNNKNSTGTAVLNGLEWTVRMQDDNIVLQEGALARVVAVEGVKLILVPEEDKIL